MFKLIRKFNTTSFYSPKFFNFSSLNSIEYFNNISFANIVMYYSITALHVKSLKLAKTNYIITGLLLALTITSFFLI